MQGISILIDLFGVLKAKYHSENFLKDLLLQTVDKCGLSLITSQSYQFENQIKNDAQQGGTTNFVLLKESHISIHTWPEEQSMVIDIFTCGNQGKAHKAMEYILERIEFSTKVTKIIGRGVYET